jgi:hypothetical protein
MIGRVTRTIITGITMNLLATILLFTLSSLFASTDGTPSLFDLFLKVTEVNASCKVSKDVAKDLLSAIYAKPAMKLMMIGDQGPVCSGQYQYKTVFTDFGMEDGLLFMKNTFHVFKIDHFQGRTPTPIFKVHYKAEYPNHQTLRRATITVSSLDPEDLNNPQ